MTDRDCWLTAWPSMLVRCLLGAAVLLSPLVASAVEGTVAMVDTIAVKYRDDALPPDASALPDSDRLTLGHLLKASYADLGRTRDGAFRLALDPPLSIDEARAAINRVRLNPAVLYASIVPRNPSRVAMDPKLGTIQPPVRSLIVKFRDPTITAMALGDRPLPATSLDRVAQSIGMPVVQQRGMANGAFLLRMFRPMSADAAYDIASRLAQEPDIDYADPDLWKHPTLVPNDTCYPNNTTAACYNATFFYYMHEWHLMPGATEIGGANLPPAWDITTGSPSIYIGVIDTGSLPNHPDLVGRFAAGYDFVADFAVANDSQPVQSAGCLQGGDPTLYNPLSPPCVSSRDNDPTDPGDWIDGADQNFNSLSWFYGCSTTDSSWHGSHVSGTIGALSNNAAGIAGINWVSRILPLRVLGKCGGYTSDIVEAITWGSGGAVAGVPNNANPARVLNLSLGGSAPCSNSEQDAINGALSRGTVVVISAGNTNTDASNNSPGNCNGNITVAATQRQGLKAQYSAFGTSVEISAPGGGRNYPTNSLNLVISTINNGTTIANPSGYIYAGYNGTSMSAPHIAGIASLMLSVNPTLTPAQVLSVMQTTARPFPVIAGAGATCPSAQSCNCTTALCGAGIADAGAAVAMAVPAATGAGRLVDFNGDLRTDLIWKQSPSNATATWLMNGGGTIATQLLSANGTWVIALVGDTNGDAKSDIVWRSNQGVTALWLMNGLSPGSTGILSGDAAWSVTRMADFNGDGKADLLWQGPSGATAVWLMNGLSPSSSTVISGDPAYSVTRTGDFNGDGKADLVWRSTGGVTALWLQDGANTLSSAVLSVDPAWQITQVGDFNGDFKSDILWRSTAGITALWLLDGTTVTSGTVLSSSSDWQVSHVGDFNGDGRVDLVWRRASGVTSMWLMNGTAVASTKPLSSDPSWQVVQVGDFNGDRKADLLWRHTSGVTAVWLMNGTEVTSSTIVSYDYFWSIVNPQN
jgi:serine protease